MSELEFAAAAYGAAKILTSDNLRAAMSRLFGPSVDVVAAELAGFLEYRLDNVRKVIESADRRVASDEGVIPQRVALRVLDEGSYSDDELVVEYLGGVLASSRTDQGRDDRGNAYVALVSRLSTYALRAHYICYSEFRRLLVESDVRVRIASERSRRASMFYPMGDYETAMEYGPGDDPPTLFDHAFNALEREGLVEPSASGSIEHLQQSVGVSVDETGVILAPTLVGIELFLWAQGCGQYPVHMFLSSALVGRR